jgi:anti-sigma regulatory factor (Ser/Thr protein kinase)
VSLDPAGDDGLIDVSASIGLEPAPEAAGNARRFVIQFCQAADLPVDISETAALLTSELVTNAVLHGHAHATIRVQQPPSRLRVSVQNRYLEPADGSGERPPEATNGRGLRIIAALAADWGIDSGEDGKTVWFELRTA